ncbi:MAG TPA: putative Ig domain-containing protein [Longimicrobiales bacterium]|nr:putative Ig domain-containing protein [Longimicrobiales bacterium]
MSRGRLPAVLLLALAAAACGGSPSGPAPEPLVIVTESLPAATRGEPYAEGVHAEGGNRAYTWELTAGTLPPGLALTVDDLGVDDAIITGTPTQTGTFTFTLRVRSRDGQADTRQFTLVVMPEPVPLAVLSRWLPPALAGAPYNVPLRASGGDGQTYAWEVVEGHLPAGIALTADGRLEGTPAGTGSATFTVEVRSGGVSTRIAVELRVVANDANAFRITLFEVASVPAAVRPHLQAAVGRWEAAVTGNLPVVTVPTTFFGASHCGGFGSHVNGTSADDVLIIVNIMPIDGPGRVLGRAGPCGLRQTGLLPFAGILTLDSDDLLPIAGTETLTDIITHEIGHVLGFGTLWESLGLVAGAGSDDPRFTGPIAVAEFQALGGVGAVPLETQGGEGTAESHWRKSVFRTELMTGFAEPVGVSQPLSRVSIASQADLGYTVNLNAAEAFALGAALIAPDLQGDRHMWDVLGYDVVERGPVLVLRDDGRARVLELR